MCVLMRWIWQVPVFIAEIAPKNLRGGLATSNQLLICSGSSATYIIGALVAWRNLVLVGLVPCVLLLGGLFFIPESPRWLVRHFCLGECYVKRDFLY
jgi:SP family sugar porter-like MFS transporter